MLKYGDGGNTLTWSTGNEIPLKLQKPEFYNTNATTRVKPILNEFPERQSAYTPGRSEFFYKNIEPFGYQVLSNLEGGSKDAKEGTLKNNRYDAWAMYLGLPQENKTFSESKYRPSSEINKKSTYYSLPKEQEEKILRKAYINKYGISLPDNTTSSSSAETRSINSIMEEIKRSGKRNVDSQSGVMGKYKTGFGKDEKGDYMSYYDLWDLHPKGKIFGNKEASELAGAGKPFEIYGRIYYDPMTGKRLEEFKKGGYTSIMQLLKNI